MFFPIQWITSVLGSTALKGLMRCSWLLVRQQCMLKWLLPFTSCWIGIQLRLFFFGLSTPSLHAGSVIRPLRVSFTGACFLVITLSIFRLIGEPRSGWQFVVTVQRSTTWCCLLGSHSETGEILLFSDRSSMPLKNATKSSADLLNTPQILGDLFYAHNCFLGDFLLPNY